MIREESGTDWKEMYQVFNMGHRFEVYTDPDTAEEMIRIAEAFQIEARVVGRCEPCKQRKLTIVSEHGTFEY